MADADVLGVSSAHIQAVIDIGIHLPTESVAAEINRLMDEGVISPDILSVELTPGYVKGLGFSKRQQIIFWHTMYIFSVIESMPRVKQ